MLSFGMSESICVDISFYLLSADEIVITTGSALGYRNDLNDTKLIKIRYDGSIITTPTPCKLPDYPFTLYGAKGNFLLESNDNMICGGGNYWEGMTTNKCYQFNTDDIAWKEVSPLKIKRYRHAITSIDRSIVTCGGGTASRFHPSVIAYKALSSCEILENGKGQWTTMKPLPTRLTGHCMVAMDASTIAVLGGYGPSGVRI